MDEIIMIGGCPASGKSSLVEQFKGYERLNRDMVGGSLADIAVRLEQSIKAKRGGQYVLDNTYHTAISRKPVIEVAKRNKIPVQMVWLNTSIEDAQINAVTRMIQRYGKLLMPEEIAAKKDPNMFPIAVLFMYRKACEVPTKAEGFDSLEIVKFVRKTNPDYKGKAVFLDYDGTLRTTKAGKYPLTTGEIELLPGRAAALKKYQSQGYRLLGVSNQSGVAKGDLTAATASACFEHTNRLLGLDIDFAFCPHSPAPISCYCRKPGTGMIVQFVEKYKLDRSQCLFVGDQTTDKTCATRSGIKFVHANEFFGA